MFSRTEVSEEMDVDGESRPVLSAAVVSIIPFELVLLIVFYAYIEIELEVKKRLLSCYNK